MKVVFLSEFFCEGMGYLENMLPKYLARKGVETHVIATDLSPSYRYERKKPETNGLPAPLPAGTIEKRDGYTLHVVGHRRVNGYMRMVGLRHKLLSIKPDIVQTIPTVGWIPLEAALYKPLLKYKFFTACHTTASVFPLANGNLPFWSGARLKCFFSRTLPGQLIHCFAERCYAATVDCSEVANKFMGVPKSKLMLSPLGVDTELFGPIQSQEQREERKRLRLSLGFSDSEIVCIYTGRLNEDKNPLLLAKAIECLIKEKHPYRGLFVGSGCQAAEIVGTTGCVVQPPVPVSKLGEFFRAADIGVWPTQESMSMLDAAACGLPIIVNSTLAAIERIDNNGLKYLLNDKDDLVRALLELRDPDARSRMGAAGARKMEREFSWDSIAVRRVRDYGTAIGAQEEISKAWSAGHSKADGKSTLL